MVFPKFENVYELVHLIEVSSVEVRYDFRILTPSSISTAGILFSSFEKLRSTFLLGQFPARHFHTKDLMFKLFLLSILLCLILGLAYPLLLF